MARLQQDTPGGKIETTKLPDGSVCRVSWFRTYSVMIDRLVDGEVVWGQVFAGEDSVLESIERVRASMMADPSKFNRRHRLWDEQGRATS